MKNIWLSLAANKRIPEVISCGITNDCVTTWFKSRSYVTFHEGISSGSTYVIWYGSSGTCTSLEIQVSELISLIVFSSTPKKLKDLKYYLDRYDRYIAKNNIKPEVENVAINALDKHFGLTYRK